MSGMFGDLGDAAEEAMIRLALFDEGRSLTTKLPLTEHRVSLALRLVDESGIAERVAAWRAEDRQSRGLHPGGRPPVINDRTVIALFLLLAVENTSLLVMRATEIVMNRLTPVTRELLGLPDDGATQPQVYDRVWRALHSFLDVVDPFPLGPNYADSNRRSFLTKEKFAEVLEARDGTGSSLKQERIDWVANQMIAMTLRFVPRSARRKWKGLACVDATVVAAFGQRRAKRSDDESPYCSIETDAAWYGRSADPLEASGAGGSGAKIKGLGKPAAGKKWTFGWEASLIVQGDNAGEPTGQFPLLVMRMAFHKPGHEPGRHAAEMVAQINQGPNKIQMLAGDLAYPNSKIENFQAPLRKLGVQLCFDYRKDQLGIQGGFEGANFIEGHFYCPSMPKLLVEASIDFRAQRIDEDTYQERIAQRRRYLFRAKGLPDQDGHVRLMCPAVGPSATAACALKETTKVAGKTRIFVVPEHPGKVCDQKTVTFPFSSYAKFGQELQYKSPEWSAAYNPVRATIEAYNGFIKDGNYEALDQSSKRRVRGYTAQFFLCSLLVLSANLRKIDTWFAEREERKGAPAKKGRAKRRTDTIDSVLQRRSTSTAEPAHATPTRT
jgi:hypothetical protein